MNKTQSILAVRQIHCAEYRRCNFFFQPKLFVQLTCKTQHGGKKVKLVTEILFSHHIKKNERFFDIFVGPFSVEHRACE